jgi:hypothetical protein
MASKGGCRTHKLALVVVALVVVLTLTAVYFEAHPSPSAAQAAGIVQSLSASTPVLNYQGRLLDPATGNPMANGTYRMAFSLYGVEAGGSPLWTEIKNVSVSGGLFNTLLGDTTSLNLSIFDGRALWLGVTVGADPESVPRMPIAYAPYALHAGHAGNADALGGLPSSAFAPATHTHGAADVTAGTLSTARYSAYIDLLDETKIGAAVDQVAAGNHLHDSRYYQQADVDKAFVNDNANEVGNPDVPAGALTPDRIAGNAWTASNDGSGSGLDADLLDGSHGSAFAAASHSHDAAAVTAGTLSTDRYSAFADLAAEMRIGEGASQVAYGNHSHDTRYFTESESDARFVKKAGDTMSGALTVPRVVYTAPRTQYFVVGGEGFVPGSNVDYVNTYGNGGANIVSGAGALVAPVHLPQGAVVTQLKVFFYDGSTSDMTVILQGQGMIGGYFYLAQVSSAGISGYGNSATTSIGNNPIDNTTYSYCIYAYCTAWDGSNLRIKGALIAYTISEAP